MKTPLISSLLASIVLLPISAFGANITIDGSFKDWGITTTGSAADWQPKGHVMYTVEDQSDANGGYLNPGWGGQAYDAEALYVSWQTKANGQTYLDIALITGHDPSTPTGNGSYGRGDFAIDFGRNGSWDFGIATAARSSTIKQGDVIATTNANWSTGLWSGPGDYDPAHSNYVTKLNGGSDVGDATLAISSAFTNMGTLGGNHWFYELEVPVSVFGSHWVGNNPSEAFNVQWTMLCANDLISVGVNATQVPEPATLALTLGGLTLAGLRRRRH